MPDELTVVELPRHRNRVTGNKARGYMIMEL